MFKRWCERVISHRQDCNLRFSAHRSDALTAKLRETGAELGHICVLHSYTAGISTAHVLSSVL